MDRITSKIESILFVAGEPVLLSELCRGLELTEGELKQKLFELQLSYEADDRGLRLFTTADTAQLTTAAANADAVEAVLRQTPVDARKRNILLCHQFITGCETSDSEERAVGGLDNIDASVFDAFDYVALGHIHKPQKVLRETLRYAGSPLKYSFSDNAFLGKKDACILNCFFCRIDDHCVLYQCCHIPSPFRIFFESFMLCQLIISRIPLTLNFLFVTFVLIPS